MCLCSQEEEEEEAEAIGGHCHHSIFHLSMEAPKTASRCRSGCPPKACSGPIQSKRNTTSFLHRPPPYVVTCLASFLPSSLRHRIVEFGGSCQTVSFTIRTQNSQLRTQNGRPRPRPLPPRPDPRASLCSTKSPLVGSMKPWSLGVQPHVWPSRLARQLKQNFP